ncbi:hypothetical protein [Kordia sp.]|uniref:hypothetical protein n=1 Tax=Kordia sp. TaxID=1965332 RepID=UPI003D2B0961
MNYTETEIIKIAKKTMRDIGWEYNSNENLVAIFNSKEEQIKGLDNVYNAGFLPNEITYDEAKNKIKTFWIIGFDFEDETEISNNKIFMEIDDLTGEPYEFRHKQAFFDIKKTKDGRYFVEFRRYR